MKMVRVVAFNNYVMADRDTDIRPGATAKSPERGHKIKYILGHDAPDAYITNAKWYLRPEHGAKDIWINPEGSVRGGTLPALIERLTMHDNRGMLTDLPLSLPLLNRLQTRVSTALF